MCGVTLGVWNRPVNVWGDPGCARNGPVNVSGDPGCVRNSPVNVWGDPGVRGMK